MPKVKIDYKKVQLKRLKRSDKEKLGEFIGRDLSLAADKRLKHALSAFAGDEALVVGLFYNKNDLIAIAPFFVEGDDALIQAQPFCLSALADSDLLDEAARLSKKFVQKIRPGKLLESRADAKKASTSPTTHATSAATPAPASTSKPATAAPSNATPAFSPITTEEVQARKQKHGQQQGPRNDQQNDAVYAPFSPAADTPIERDANGSQTAREVQELPLEEQPPARLRVEAKAVGGKSLFSSMRNRALAGSKKTAEQPPASPSPSVTSASTATPASVDPKKPKRSESARNGASHGELERSAALEEKLGAMEAVAEAFERGEWPEGETRIVRGRPRGSRDAASSKQQQQPRVQQQESSGSGSSGSGRKVLKPSVIAGEQGSIAANGKKAEPRGAGATDDAAVSFEDFEIPEVVKTKVHGVPTSPRGNRRLVAQAEGLEGNDPAVAAGVCAPKNATPCKPGKEGVSTCNDPEHLKTQNHPLERLSGPLRGIRGEGEEAEPLGPMKNLGESGGVATKQEELPGSSQDNEPMGKTNKGGVVETASPHEAARLGKNPGYRLRPLFSSRKRVLAAAAITVVAISSVVGGVTLFSSGVLPMGSGIEQSQGIKEGGASTRITVEEGDSINSVCAKLDSAGMGNISSEVSSQLRFMSQKTASDKGVLKPGSYEFSSADTPASIATALLNGSESVALTVTVQSGDTVRDIAKKINESNPAISYDAALAAMDADIYRKDFSMLSGVKAKTVEGYIAAVPYSFSKDDGPEDIVRSMLYSMQVSSTQYNDFENTLTLASILEKEAPVDSDKQTMAATFKEKLSSDGASISKSVEKYAEDSGEDGYKEKKSGAYAFGPICAVSAFDLFAASHPLS